ncbi:UNVERIFIED_CONTAM: hypothetical protein K2H54_028559, partial [Gekko kuhli]
GKSSWYRSIYSGTNGSCRNQDLFSPSIMNLLTLSLVAVLVATAHSLICKCTDCNPQGTCSVPDFGVCLTITQETNLGGPKTSGVFRSCEWNTQSCEQKVMTITGGKGLYWTSNTECCTTDNCNAGPISVPPVSLTPNGLKCPTCFAFRSASDCEADEMLTCTGTQDHCISISGFVNEEGGLSSPFIAKGCSTATACFLPLATDLYSSGISFNFNNIICNPSPSHNSGQ